MTIGAQRMAIAVLGAALVAGCMTGASFPDGDHSSTRVNCPGGMGADDRCLEVWVITVGGQPQIRPIPDTQMPRQGAIWWVIKTPGYSFPANGIDFANPGTPPPGSPPKTVAPAGEFTGCMPMAPNDTRYKCINHHASTGSYGYKVSLNGTPAVPALDPFIINN